MMTEPYSMSEHDTAAAEARERGMAFLVHGKHVSADHIMILSLPDTVGPISNMRKAKIDAQAALADMEAFAANVSKPMNKAHVEMTGQHLRQLMDAAGMPKPPAHHDDVYLGMHSYITMLDIEAQVRMLAASKGGRWAVVERQKLLDEMSWLVDQGAEQAQFITSHETYIDKLQREVSEAHGLLGEAREALGMQDSLETQDEQSAVICKIDAVLGVVPSSVGQQALFDSEPANRSATCSTVLHRHRAAPAPVVIDGILVTDPELAAPITPAAPGESFACGDCGKLFSREPGGPAWLFCDAHRDRP